MLINNKIGIIQKSILLCSLIMITGTTMAAEGVTKDEWVKIFKEKAPAAICERLVNSDSTKLILSAKNMTYDKCMAAIPKSVDKCVQENSSLLPATFDINSGRDWGGKIGKCIGLDFYEKNL